MISEKGGQRTKGLIRKSSLSQPLVSVITPVFNGRRHIEQTILSVTGQSYGNIEYIILDGGSTDGTVDIIKKYEGRIDYWQSGSDSGIYDAMNTGISNANGELIGIINSDDYYLDGAISKIVAAAINYPDADLFHGDLRFEMNNGKAEIWHSKEVISRKDAWRMPINHPTVFMRSSSYRRIGFYNTKYRVAADYDLIVRCLAGNVKFRYVNETLAAMRQGGASCRYSMETFHDGIEILSSSGSSFLTKARFSAWYLRLMFLQFLGRPRIRRSQCIKKQ